MGRLLLVDDESAIRQLYAEELSEDGHEVKTAGNSKRALELMELFKFDLLILDIRLDRENGLDLLRKIVNRGEKPPVVLCTAFSSFQDDFTSWLADSYVVKSSDTSQLKREVQRLLEKKH